MKTVPPRNDTREPRRRGPSVRARFVARAETLKTDPAFKRNICRLRAAWNRTYPAYALGDPAVMPDRFPGDRLRCLPPALAREHDAAILAGRTPSAENEAAYHRWNALVLRLCQWGWPADYYPNWLGLKREHPAVLFASAAMIYRMESIPPGASIITGGPPALPLIFDPEDELSHPAAACWYAFATHMAGSLRAAIDDGERIDLSWLEATGMQSREAGHRAWQAAIDAGAASPYWYVRVFPGITTMDRDEIMSHIMEAAAHQYGDHPLRTPVQELSAKGKSQSSIAKLLGVDRATVGRLLSQR